MLTYIKNNNFDINKIYTCERGQEYCQLIFGRINCLSLNVLLDCGLNINFESHSHKNPTYYFMNPLFVLLHCINFSYEKNDYIKYNILLNLDLLIKNNVNIYKKYNSNLFIIDSFKYQINHTVGFEFYTETNKQFINTILEKLETAGKNQKIKIYILLRRSTGYN